MSDKSQYQGSETWLLSLTKLTGQAIEDIEGYTTNEFGEPCFKLCRVRLANGYWFYVEGEHDLPYLTYGPTDFTEFGELIDKLDEEDD